MRSAWSEQKGLPCESLDVFQQLFRLRNNRRLLVAFHEGKVVAGSVLRFLQGSLVEYAANSSWPEARRLRPNDLLQWKAIEWACRQGFRYYSLGGSDHFHKKFGGTVVPTYRYRLDRTWLRRHVRKDELVEYAHKLYHRLLRKSQRIQRRPTTIRRVRQQRDQLGISESQHDGCSISMSG
jgi:CelD/BcsL family acetyltransferase involved in cellulose biosynthesis